jgi:hypothetical protein
VDVIQICVGKQNNESVEIVQRRGKEMRKNDIGGESS